MHQVQQTEAPKGERVHLLTEKDLNVSYFYGSGAGGQTRNKVVQIRHEEFGATGRASDSRSQADNKRKAFERMLETPQMKFWLSKRLYEVRAGEKLEDTVEKECTENNLRYEVKNATGQWEVVSKGYFESVAAKEEV
jgi:protein subunit release factor B